MLGFSAENHFDFKFSKGPTLRISYRIFVLIERPVLLGILISLVIVLVLTPSDCSQSFSDSLAIWFAVISVFVSDERLILVVISFFLLAETLALGSASRCWFSVPFLKDATTSILATNIKGSLSSPSCVVRAATTSTASSKAASKAASAAPAASTSSKSFILLYEIIQTLMLNCVHSYGFCALK
jgi:hypothetical protein